MPHTSFNRSRGYYLLEFALALPCLLAIALIIWDIGALVQARRALDSGLSEGLRCLATVEGPCKSAAPAEPAFDVYSTNQTSMYVGLLRRYQARAQRALAPVLEYADISATVLGQVSYEVPGKALAARRELYPARGVTEYALLTAESPYVSGDSLSYRFSDPLFRQEAYPALRFGQRDSLDISGLRGSAAGPERVILGSLRFSIPAPTELRAGMACLHWRAGWLESCRSLRLSGTPSAPSEIGFAAATPITIAVTGRRLDLAGGSAGAVRMALSQGGRRIELGGRQLNSPATRAGVDAPANFVPRGVPALSVEESFAEHYREFERYSEIVVEYGQQITLEFELIAESGEIGWQGDAVKIFLPRFLAVSEERSCLDRLPRSSSERPGDCRLEPPVLRAKSVRISDSQPAELGEPLFLGCDEGIDGEEELKTRGEDPRDYRFQEAGSENCPRQAKSETCPESGDARPDLEPNLGQADPTDAQAALRVCPPAAAQFSDPIWSEKRQALDERLIFKPRDCLNQAPARADLPPALARFKKLDLGEPALLRYESADADPASLNCSIFSSRAIELSLEPGEWSAAEASQAGCDFNRLLQAKSARLGFPAHTLSEMRSEIVGEEVLSGLPEAASCREFRLESVHGGGLRRIAEHLSYAEAQAVCRGRGTACRILPADELSAASAAQQAAATYARRSMFALYPPAANCGQHCLSLSFQRGELRAEGAAELEVPLRLLGRTIRMSARGSRKLE